MLPQVENPSETITPLQARREFLNTKKGQIKQSSLRTYKFPTKHFIEFCDSHGIESIGDVNGYVIESWKRNRQEENIKQITFHNNVKKVRVFIRWCESAELIEYGTADRMDIPNVSRNQAVSNEVLELHEAEHILQYLNTYEYASRQHALFQVMWHTACRASGAIALDVADFEPQGDVPTLKFRNRKSQGTALKNGNASERNVSVNEQTKQVLEDYINQRRENVIDEFDREPLFCTQSQRLTRQRAYKNFTALSRPCFTNDVCPHDRDIDSCEAAQKVKKAFGCPSSTSLHPIRRGAITYHIDRNWPKEKLAERVDVSVEVLNKHYDARTKEKERQGRKQYLDSL